MTIVKTGKLNLFVILLFLGLGCVNCGKHHHIDYQWTNNYRNDITDSLIENVDGERIRRNLRHFTTDPHPAGTVANRRVAQKIAETWTENGLEDVHFNTYNVLLSYPNYSNPNHVGIFDTETEETLFENVGVSPAIIPDEQGAPGAGVQWLAYSPNGTVDAADVVYCHYGTAEDFRRLRTELGVSVRGRVALMRYRSEWRGSKVMNAQLNGAVGALLYSDPEEFAKDGVEATYPNTVWMPKDGVQRGTLKNRNGDPLTPLYPARPDLFPSLTIDDAKKLHDLPSIPAIPLSYSDAYQILSRLSGAKAPGDWQGGLNVTYRLGPGFKNAKKAGDEEEVDENLKLRLSVNSRYEHREIQNVIGYIFGKEEPDEYVILGNHFDAWVYGSIDPNSGTATLAEVARTLTATMAETNWRPARTIIFCNWDAEEYGLVGSVEFVQDFANILSDRAVVYINVDLLVDNKTFNADTTPALYDVLVDVARRVPNPVDAERARGHRTVYDTWIERKPSRTAWLPAHPEMRVPGGGSDHSGFLTYLGVPVIDMRYQNDTDGYPLYHTLYETPFVNEHLYDTDNFAVHRAVGQLWAELAHTFADATILPLNTTTLAQKLLADYVATFKATLESHPGFRDPEMKPAKQQLSFLIRKCQEFLRRSENFAAKITEVENHRKQSKARKRPPAGRLNEAQINQRLKAVERCFINPRGEMANPEQRHVLFSLSENNTYQAQVMAALYEQLDNYGRAETPEERTRAGRELTNQISVIQYSVQCAVNTLSDII